jgi:hypothetical protein
VVHPQGFQFLQQFRLNPFPTFTFSVDALKSKKRCSWFKARTPQSSTTVSAA